MAEAPNGQPDLSRLGTKRRLENAEERERFCEAVVEHGGVRPAAKALGLHTPTVWTYAEENEEFRKMLRAARRIAAEQRYDECIEISDDPVLDARQKHVRIETRMRVAGKLMPKEYGDQPQTQVNVQNVVGVVVNDEQRKRLIEMRQSLAEQISGAIVPPMLAQTEEKPSEATVPDLRHGPENPV